MVVGELTEETQLLVIGGGPGGYVAAFHAADLGVQTTIVDSSELLGGVCLREGCIPSKALLHVAHLIENAAEADKFGLEFKAPKIDVDKVRAHKQGVVDKLCGGVKLLAKKRSVNVIHGRATFENSKSVRVQGENTSGRVKFKHCIIATGSSIKYLPESLIKRDLCLDSTTALELESVPKTMAVIGGGYIGLELGQVYAALGSKVTVIEALDRILAGADPDLARPLEQRLKKQFEAILTGAKLEGSKKTAKGVELQFTHDGKQQKQTFEKVLVSVGRAPNSKDLGLENTKVKVNDRGFIEIDEQCRTADPKIFAIGDVAGDPMLAHKASREGMVAAEVIAGQNSVYDVRAVPAVVYTSPEVAWCGVTEAEAKQQKKDIKIGKFGWGANGRAIAIGRTDGLTKVIIDKESNRVLGVGIVGEHAGDMIAEAVLAMEMGATAEDIAMSIHPHPSLSETMMEAAEAATGHAIHMAK